MNLVAELQRRNVVRMAGLYLVGAWLIVQVSATLLPAFGAPPWVLRVLVALLVIGFVGALVFSWVYELTPEGVKRDADVAPGKSIARQTGRRMDRLIIAVLGLALGYFALDKFVLAPQRQPAESTAEGDAPAAGSGSVAVLPFANLSGKPEEEYFSDGMTEELLNVLARIPNLNVAARTSVFEFKGKGGDVREIGRKLGVTHIVEGSVRRQGEQVRITAQLIRVDDGFHAWSESYDRRLDDVFALQDEIAAKISARLQTTLGTAPAPVAREAIDPVAYDEYLRGRALHRQRTDIPQAIAHLESAAARAPEYAPAWAWLTLAHEVAYWYTTPAQRELLGDPIVAMRRAAERAQALDPGAATTLHALANVARAEMRYTDAEALYRRAIAADPTYPDVREDFEELLEDTGQSAESDPALQELLRLEPFVWIYWFRMASNGIVTGDRERVAEGMRRMRSLGARNRWAAISVAQLFVHEGDAEGARTAMAEALAFAPDLAAADAELLRWALREPGVDEAHARAAIVANVDNVLYAALRGDPDPVFEALEHPQAAGARYKAHRYLSAPVAAKLLAEPRFKSLLERFGFVRYWREKGWPAQCRPLGDTDFVCTPAPEAR